jgi:hypothetical protein
MLVCQVDLAAAAAIQLLQLFLQAEMLQIIRDRHNKVFLAVMVLTKVAVVVVALAQPVRLEQTLATLLREAKAVMVATEQHGHIQQQFMEVVAVRLDLILAKVLVAPVAVVQGHPVLHRPTVVRLVQQILAAVPEHVNLEVVLEVLV